MQVGKSPPHSRHPAGELPWHRVLQSVWSTGLLACVRRTAEQRLIPTPLLGCFPEVLLLTSQFLCNRKRIISLALFFTSCLLLLPVEESVRVSLGQCDGVLGIWILTLFGFDFKRRVNFSLFALICLLLSKISVVWSSHLPCRWGYEHKRLQGQDGGSVELWWVPAVQAARGAGSELWPLQRGTGSSTSGCRALTCLSQACALVCAAGICSSDQVVWILILDCKQTMGNPPACSVLLFQQTRLFWARFAQWLQGALWIVIASQLPWGGWMEEGTRRVGCFGTVTSFKACVRVRAVPGCAGTGLCSRVAAEQSEVPVGKAVLISVCFFPRSWGTGSTLARLVMHPPAPLLAAFCAAFLCAPVPCFSFLFLKRRETPMLIWSAWL